MLVLLYLSLVASALAQFATQPDDGAFPPVKQDSSAALCKAKCMMYPFPLKIQCFLKCPTGSSSGFDEDFGMPAVREVRVQTREECLKICKSLPAIHPVVNQICAQKCPKARMLKDETFEMINKEFSEVPAVSYARRETRQQCIARCQKLPEYSFQALTCLSECPRSRNLDNAMEVSEKGADLKQARVTFDGCINQCRAKLTELTEWTEYGCDMACSKYSRKIKETYLPAMIEAVPTGRDYASHQACYDRCMARHNNDGFYTIGCAIKCP